MSSHALSYNKTVHRKCSRCFVRHRIAHTTSHSNTMRRRNAIKSSHAPSCTTRQCIGNFDRFVRRRRFLRCDAATQCSVLALTASKIFAEKVDRLTRMHCLSRVWSQHRTNFCIHGLFFFFGGTRKIIE